jgi:hypothetical protein
MTSFSRASLFLLIVGALACSDGTAPREGTFEVSVTPDTLLASSVGVDLHIRLQNSSSKVIEQDWCEIAVERESAPGVWPDSPSQTTCAMIDMEPGYDQTFTRTAPSEAGRYRMAYPFRLRGSSGILDHAYSNVFVVISR